MAAGQRGRNGRHITTFGRVEEDSGAVLTQALVKLLRVDTDQPVQPVLGVRTQPRFQALGTAIPLLYIGVVIDVGSPESGITPVTVKAVFHPGLSVAADDSQRRRPDPGKGEAQRCARGMLRVDSGPVGLSVTRSIERERVIAIVDLNVQQAQVNL